MLRLFVVPAAATAIMLAGCGGGSTPGTSHPSSPPASASAQASTGLPPATATLVKQVISALKAATSVHVTGSVTQDGSTDSVDLGVTHSNDLSGQIAAKNSHVAVLVTQGHSFVKVPNAASLDAMGLPSAYCQIVCGKYLELTAADAKGLVEGLSWSGLFGQVSPEKQLSYVRTTTFDGQPVWEMKAADGTTAYLAARGAPYPLRMTKGSDYFEFTQWNSVTIPPPPPASQIINLNQLKGM